MRLVSVVLATVLCTSCHHSHVSITGTSGLATRPSNPTCVAFAKPTSSDFELQPAWSHMFNAPVALRQIPGDDTTFFVLEQPGRVQRIGADASSTPTLAIDITDRVNYGGEAGLLGIAFHPQFATNGKMYLSYTADGINNAAVYPLESHLSEFTSTDGGKTFDKATERVLLRINQPFTNHNGGNILFGPDGFMYAGFGDGGSGGDPMKNGQNTNVLLAKMLRIDVDSKATGKEYGIPPTNPFADGKKGAPEIFAYGLRNPWRWSFDKVTGVLWVGDVGQDAWEEIDIVELGKDYGWNGKEGTHCYDTATCMNPLFVDPLVEHSHSEANAIIGGYVYHGMAVPSLMGKYLYADEVTGNMWTIPASGHAEMATRVKTSIGNPTSFGEDQSGELYLVMYNGTINRIVAATAAGAGDTVPATLSLTGCTSPTDAKTPAAGLIPYTVNSPLWSDGADKSRWMGLPDGTTITVNSDGDFSFPKGTVLVKEFRLGGKRIETRLMVHHQDDSWAGYTYEWRDDESDADLLADGKDKTIGTQTWTYPSRSDCLRCHTAAAGFALGPEIGQLNGDYAYPAATAGGMPITGNQLVTLDKIGVVALTDQVKNLDQYPDPQSAAAPLADRARAYLHANCAQCHRAGGTTPVTIDLRYDLAFSSTLTCNVAPSAGDLGVTGALIIAPGQPTKSVLNLRVHADAANVSRMPPLARNLVDTAGVKLLDDWVTSLTECSK